MTTSNQFHNKNLRQLAAATAAIHPDLDTARLTHLAGDEILASSGPTFAVTAKQVRDSKVDRAIALVSFVDDAATLSEIFRIDRRKTVRNVVAQHPAADSKARISWLPWLAENINPESFYDAARLCPVVEVLNLEHLPWMVSTADMWAVEALRDEAVTVEQVTQWAQSDRRDIRQLALTRLCDFVQAGEISLTAALGYIEKPTDQLAVLGTTRQPLTASDVATIVAFPELCKKWDLAAQLDESAITWCHDQLDNVEATSPAWLLAHKLLSTITDPQKGRHAELLETLSNVDFLVESAEGDTPGLQEALIYLSLALSNDVSVAIEAMNWLALNKNNLYGKLRQPTMTRLLAIRIPQAPFGPALSVLLREFHPDFDGTHASGTQISASLRLLENHIPNPDEQPHWPVGGWQETLLASCWAAVNEGPKGMVVLDHLCLVTAQVGSLIYQVDFEDAITQALHHHRPSPDTFAALITIPLCTNVVRSWVHGDLGACPVDETLFEAYAERIKANVTTIEARQLLNLLSVLVETGFYTDGMVQVVRTTLEHATPSHTRHSICNLAATWALKFPTDSVAVLESAGVDALEPFIEGGGPTEVVLNVLRILGAESRCGTEDFMKLAPLLTPGMREDLVNAAITYGWPLAIFFDPADEESLVALLAQASIPQLNAWASGKWEARCTPDRVARVFNATGHVNLYSHALAIDPTNPQLLAAAHTVGGLPKTLLGDTTWSYTGIRQAVTTLLYPVLEAAGPDGYEAALSMVQSWEGSFEDLAAVFKSLETLDTIDPTAADSTDLNSPNNVFEHPVLEAAGSQAVASPM